MGFMFEDRHGQEWFFKDDFLARLATLDGIWSDPMMHMKKTGYKLVGADETGQRWLTNHGYHEWEVADQPGHTDPDGDNVKRGMAGKEVTKSPYMTACEAAVYVRKTTKAFYAWAERKNLKPAKGSRKWLVTKEQLDEALRGETVTSRRRGRR